MFGITTQLFFPGVTGVWGRQPPYDDGHPLEGSACVCCLCPSHTAAVAEWLSGSMATRHWPAAGHCGTCQQV